nr:hypothetical protein [Actinomycetales bacterium]
MEIPTIPGYRATGIAGHGARGGTPTVVAEDGRSGVAVVVERGLEMRVRSLRDLGHPALPAIVDVVRLDDGAAVILEPVAGPSLATLVQARGRLAPRELATLWQSLADALAAMHQRDLTHGDVSPGNIVVTASGPVLLDIVGHAGRESGYRGHVAPEVAVGGAPSPAADVWALARAISWASDDDPAVARALGSALADTPALRPTARAFATWAYLLGEPGPISIPDGATLAGAQVRAGVSETVLLPPGAPRRRPGWVVWAAVAAIAAAGVISLLDDGGGPAPASSPAAGVADAGAAVEDLLHRRDAALAEHDAGALHAVHLADSAALSADLDLLVALQEEWIELEGFGTDVLGVKVLTQADEAAIVEATIVQREHAR